MLLSCYALNTPDIPNITPSQWHLAEAVVSFLSPFEEVARSMSSSSVSISLVIPSVRVLRTILTSDGTSSSLHEGGNLRHAILAALDTRFNDYNPLFNQSTY